MKIKGFIFSEDHSEALVEGLRTPRRRGMSGCQYGPSYGPIPEAWHISSGGYLENYLPILVGREEDPSTRIPSNMLKKITSPAIAAGMLMQVSQVYGRYEAENLLDTPLAVGYPLFVVHTHYEERNLGVHYGEPLRYIRPPWPENPVLRWGDFELPVPRVGWGNVETIQGASAVYEADGVFKNVTVACSKVTVGKVRVYLAQPEGRGKMFYKINDSAPIKGGEILGSLRQEDCQIRAFPPEKEVKLLDLLINRRLGDLLLADKKEAEEFGLQETGDLGSARLEENNECIILLHPEHGLLRVQKGDNEYGIYKVPYHVPPGD